MGIFCFDEVLGFDWPHRSLNGPVRNNPSIKARCLAVLTEQEIASRRLRPRKRFEGHAKARRAGEPGAAEALAKAVAALPVELGAGGGVGLYAVLRPGEPGREAVAGAARCGERARQATDAGADRARIDSARSLG